MKKEIERLNYHIGILVIIISALVLLTTIVLLSGTDYIQFSAFPSACVTFVCSFWIFPNSFPLRKPKAKNQKPL